jgi:signal transduction histidine kinase
VYSIAIMFFFIILILLGGIIMLLKYSASRLWSPFYDTLSQIHDFEIDKNNPPNFIPTDINEFNRLNKSLEKLIEKNTAIFKSQKEFIENAAHELQTPLALFQTKIELLAQLPAISKEESQLISSLNNDVARMNRLNKNLLLLSKIDNNTYTEQQEVVLNDYIEKNLEFFVEQAKSKQIVITTNLKDKVAINTNPILVEVLINNLFLNAIRHNVQDGTITITTYNNNSIIFTNTASAGALNVNKLFNRFSKSNPSSQGNGLGLAIVKKIAEISNWEISYNYNRTDNLHFFTANFNANR